MTSRRTKVRLLAMLMAVCAAEPVVGQPPTADQSASSARVAVFDRFICGQAERDRLDRAFAELDLSRG